MMLIGTTRARIKEKNNLKQMKKEGMTYHISAYLTDGLPLPENTICQIYSFPDRYEIHGSGTIFNLDKDKVCDVTMKTDVDIERDYVSSAGGAISGAMKYGPLGARIDGRIREIKHKTVTTYLIITYSNDDIIEYIGFDVSASSLQVIKIVKEFIYHAPKEKVMIDL